MPAISRNRKAERRRQKAENRDHEPSAGGDIECADIFLAISPLGKSNVKIPAQFALEERNVKTPALSPSAEGGVETPALSLGERMSGDRAFSSRRRTGEGLVPSEFHPGWLEIRISFSPPPRTQ
jgi:hypothetical protein